MSCMHFLSQQGLRPHALFIDYGQPASELEVKSAEAVSSHYEVPLTVLRTPLPFRAPCGEVFARNAFLVFTAICHLQIKTGIIATGIHSGTAYLDCSAEFCRNVDKLVRHLSDGKLSFYNPFLSWTKAEIYEYAGAHSLPVNLTYSCEKGTLPPCGSCLSCLDRKHLKCPN